MELLASNKKVVFVGQSVAVAGTAMRTTLENISSEKLIEMPVDETYRVHCQNLNMYLINPQLIKADYNSNSTVHNTGLFVQVTKTIKNFITPRNK